MECLICKKAVKNPRGLAQHLKNQHGENVKEIYDIYYKKENEGLCKTCEGETSFRGITTGYLQFCSPKCRSADIEYRKNCAIPKIGKKQSEDTIRKRVANTDQKIKEENRIRSLQERYGVTNPAYLPEHKDKCKQTSLKNWGTEYPTQNIKVFNRVKYRKKTIIVNGYEFSDIQGYEDLFLEQLSTIFPHITYQDLLEERGKTLFRENGKCHFPDFYSKKHNHMIEIKSEWTFEKSKEDVLLKKEEAEKQGYKYTIIIWQRRTSTPYIIQ